MEKRSEEVSDLGSEDKRVEKISDRLVDVEGMRSVQRNLKQQFGGTLEVIHDESEERKNLIKKKLFPSVQKKEEKTEKEKVKYFIRLIKLS